MLQPCLIRPYPEGAIYTLRVYYLELFMPTLEELIPEKKQLTILERRFFGHLLNGAKPTDAAVLTFNVKDRKSASVRACQTLAKFNIKLPQLMDNCGLSDERLVMKMAKLLDAKTVKHFAHEGVVIDSKRMDDNATQRSTLELALKVKRYLSDINVEVNNSMTVIQHMREALREREQKNKDRQA